ncbi:MAG: hypothetical protein AAF206_18275 [Bacteroidota bacterium]
MKPQYVKLCFDEQWEAGQNVFPQVTLHPSYSRKQAGSVYKLTKQNFRHFALDTTSFRLREGASLLHIMEPVFCLSGLVVHHDIFDILIQYKLPPHRFFPFSLEGEDYYLLFVAMDLLENTIFPHSHIYTQNGLREEQKVHLNNRIEYDRLARAARDFHRDEAAMTDHARMPKPGKHEQLTQLRKNGISFYGYRSLTLDASARKWDVLHERRNFYFSPELAAALSSSPAKGIQFVQTTRINIL